MTLSSAVPSGYKFGVTYIGTQLVSPVEVSFKRVETNKSFLMTLN